MRPMVQRVIAALAIGLTLTMVAPAVGGADPGSHTPAQVYRQEVMSIDRTFRQAVFTAKAQLTYALRHASNSGQRTTARARYALAIALATTQRDQALIALGAPPRGNAVPPSTTTTTTTIH